MITGNKSSAKQLITEIVIMNCQTVHSLPHTDLGLYNAPSYLFRAFCRMYGANTGWLSRSEWLHMFVIVG